MTTPPIPPAGDNPPVKPVRPTSKRRNLTARLRRPLNPQVLDLIQTNADIAVTNLLITRAVATIAAGGSPDAATEENKVLALAINRYLKENKAAKEKIQANRGAPLTGKSKLTDKGSKDKSTRQATEGFIESGGRTMTQPYGPFGGAVTTTTGEVTAINPGLKVGAQTLQLLGHIAQLYMNRNSDMEYQVMFVNNRLLVASNKQEKIGSFAGVSLQTLMAGAAVKPVTLTKEDMTKDTSSGAARAYMIGAVSEAFRADPASKVPLTQQQRDGSAMLQEYQVGYHIEHGARLTLGGLVNLIQHHSLNDLPMHGPFIPEKAAGLITDPSYEWTVIGVHPKTAGGWHAEQALAQAMILARWNAGAAVGGTKLPCLVCFFTLSLVNQLGFPLSYVPTPGFMWDTHTLPGLAHVVKALNVPDVTRLAAEFKKAQSLTDNGFEQFMTALKEQADVAVDVSIGGKAMNARGLTQDQSQKSFYFGQYAPTPKLLPGERPPEPVQTYGTPPNSPGGIQDNDAEMEYEEDVKTYEKEKKAWDEKQAKKQEKDKDKTTTT